ncbi:hypothetical protein B0T22DRAFT_451505 [Podospora appendiculata]|uniref:Uncharacterized protein n=1 Tax=Podospora appendiculata TaxID=314037 RepID=A0AAE0XIJ2_9PEZI|nr:hypothetical protein B0T22DRAFT_451505 [Podospora appendiculata]
MCFFMLLQEEIATSPCLPPPQARTLSRPVLFKAHPQSIPDKNKTSTRKTKMKTSHTTPSSMRLPPPLRRGRRPRRNPDPLLPAPLLWPRLGRNSRVPRASQHPRGLLLLLLLLRTSKPTTGSSSRGGRKHSKRALCLCLCAAKPLPGSGFVVLASRRPLDDARREGGGRRLATATALRGDGRLRCAVLVHGWSARVGVGGSAAC